MEYDIIDLICSKQSLLVLDFHFPLPQLLPTQENIEDGADLEDIDNTHVQHYETYLDYFNQLHHHRYGGCLRICGYLQVDLPGHHDYECDPNCNESPRAHHRTHLVNLPAQQAAFPTLYRFALTFMDYGYADGGE